MTDLEKLLAEATPSPWRLFNVPFANQKLRQRVGPFLLVGEVSDADATLGSMAPDMAAALIEAEKALGQIMDGFGLDGPEYKADEDDYDLADYAWIIEPARAALAKMKELTKGE